MLIAVARLCATYGNDLSDVIFKERLGQYTAKSIFRTAKDRRPGSLGFAEALLINYNRKCKYRLSMKKLYGNRTDKTDDFESNEEEEEQDEEE